MNIQVENYTITSDTYNIVVAETKTKAEGENAGEQYKVNCGYFGTVEQALQHIVQQKIRASQARTIHELLDEVRAIRELIRDTMQGV